MNVNVKQIVKGVSILKVDIHNSFLAIYDHLTHPLVLPQLATAISLRRTPEHPIHVDTMSDSIVSPLQFNFLGFFDSIHEMTNGT